MYSDRMMAEEMGNALLHLGLTMFFIGFGAGAFFGWWYWG